ERLGGRIGRLLVEMRRINNSLRRRPGSVEQVWAFRGHAADEFAGQAKLSRLLQDRSDLRISRQEEDIRLRRGYLGQLRSEIGSVREIAFLRNHLPPELLKLRFEHGSLIYSEIIVDKQHASRLRLQLFTREWN